MSNIPVIDMIFVILLILMIVHGYVKGFIEELFSWAALVFAVWVAVLLHPAGAELIRSKAMQNVRYVPEILAFAAVFVVVVLFCKMLEKILKDVIMGAKLGGANKVLGAVFGLVEGLALITLVVFVLTIQPLFNPTAILSDSIFAQIVLSIIKIPLDRGRDILNTALELLPGLRLPGFPV